MASSHVDIRMLDLYLAATAICLVLKLTLAISSYSKVYIMGYELGARLRIKVGDYLKRLPMGFFKQRDAGDVTALLLQDIYKLEMNLTHVYQQVLSPVALAAVILLLLAAADGRMALVMLASVLVALPVLAVAQKVVKHFGARQTVSRNQTAAGILEYLRGINVIKAHNQIGPRFARLDFHGG